MTNVTNFPNPDEVISEDDTQYEAGAAKANYMLSEARWMLAGKSEMFAAGFWDVIYDVFDDGE